MAPLRVLLGHRLLLWQTVRSDVRARFAGSAFGLLWLVAYPLLLLGAYAAVFIGIYAPPADGIPARQRVLLIFCGLIPFLGFSEALQSGSGSVQDNQNLVRNTLFPIDLVPVKAVLVSQCVQVVGTGLLLIAAAGLGLLSFQTLLLPVVWLLQVTFTIGLIWILSGIQVFFRDLQYVIAVSTLMLMMLSPIAWDPDRVSPALHQLLRLNPLYFVILPYQDCVVHGRWPRGDTLPVLAVLALVSFVFGHFVFRRIKRMLLDNL